MSKKKESLLTRLKAKSEPLYKLHPKMKFEESTLTPEQRVEWLAIIQALADGELRRSFTELAVILKKEWNLPQQVNRLRCLISERVRDVKVNKSDEA